MDEKVMESTPTETTSIVDDDDFFADVDNDVISELESQDNSSNDSQVENQVENEKEGQEEIDYSPLLKELSGKIKYNGESVEVDSTDNLIENYQKGLNYDKVKQQLNDLQQSKGMQYLESKAKELGITVDEYMQQVEAYEKQQKQQKEAEELDELVANGMPESLAKELLATRQLSKELQNKISKIDADSKANEQEAKKNKEYAQFLENHKGINVDTIPKEVFQRAETIGLEAAYNENRIKDLEKQIESLKLNEKNRKSSIGSTTQFGAEDESGITDDFLLGFNS